MSHSICLINNTGHCLYRFRRHLIGALQEHGYTVTALFSFDGYEKNLTDMNVECHNINIDSHSLNPVRDIGVIISIMGIIKAIKPDLVFYFTVKPIFYSYFISKVNKVKSISMITGLGRIFAREGNFARLLKLIFLLFYKISLSQNCKVFIQNNSDLSLFIDKNIVNRDKCVLVNGSGVNLHEFYPDRKSCQFEFLMISRLFREKGVTEYCIAAQRMLEKYPISCVLVGGLERNRNILIGNQYLPEFLEYSEINYCGEQKDVLPFFHRASVFVLPTYGGEGIPRVLLEALACGLPIITTNTPGCRDTVDGNGVIIEPRSSDLLYTAMEQQFHCSKDQLLLQGKRSRTLACDRYNIQNVTAIILNTIQHVCRNTPINKAIQ